MDATPPEAPPIAPRVASRRPSTFAGDVFKLVSGTTIAQVIGVLVTPLLTRIYAPEAFGTLALFTSITSIIGVVACLRYELAIMLPETDEEAANLLAVSLLAVVAITALTVPVITLGGPLLLRLLNASQLGPYLWVVPLAVFAGGVFHALSYWSSRTRQFGRVAAMRVVNAGSTYAGKLGAGYAIAPTAGSLIGATFLGTVLSAGILASKVWHQDAAIFLRAIRPLDIRAALVRHRHFPLYGSWSALLNKVSSQLPVLLLSAYFAPAIAGYYAFSHSLLSLPIGLIGDAFASVFFQRASIVRGTGGLAEFVAMNTKWLISLSAPPFLLLFIVAPELISIVFGAQWLEAGVYTRILAPWLFFVFISSPISSLFSVLERQRDGLVFNIALISTRAASLVAGGLLGNPRLSLVLFSVSGTLLWAGICMHLITLSGLSRRATVRTILGGLTWAMVFCLPVALLQWLWEPPSLILLGAAVFAAALFYLRLVACDPKLRSAVLRRLCPKRGVAG